MTLIALKVNFNNQSPIEPHDAVVIQQVSNDPSVMNMDFTIWETEFSTQKSLRPIIQMDPNEHPIEERTNSPDKDATSNTPASSVHPKIDQPQQSYSLLSACNLMPSNVDDALNSIRQVCLNFE